MTILYGFQQLKDVFAERVNDVGVDTVNTAIQATIDEHRRQMDALTSMFATTTNEYKIRYKIANRARLQPLDENGRARPLKAAGYFDVAFPIQGAATAWGTNYVSRVKMTVEDANRATTTLLQADIEWMRDHMLAALFTNTAWTFEDEEHGNLTIKGPANGDSDQYIIKRGAAQPATDNHFGAQANAIADGTDNPFTAIAEDLTEHPENSGEIVALIPTSLKDSVESLADFKEAPDANVRTGVNTDILTGSLGVQVPGDVIGYLTGSKTWIVHWRSMVDNYILATMTGGERPLAMRQHAEPELRGFNMIAQRDDHPFYESQWARWAGFGAWNRVNAFVYRIGNASYAIPTDYASPMP